MGAVFVQPLLEPMDAGVAFFDGFYYERATTPAGNEALTSGQARGDVHRGHLEREDAWSQWLAKLHRIFGSDGNRSACTIDIEFARDQAGYVLLQSRPALFQVNRNPTLSLANHKEIL